MNDSRLALLDSQIEVTNVNELDKSALTIGTEINEANDKDNKKNKISMIQNEDEELEEELDVDIIETNKVKSMSVY